MFVLIVLAGVDWLLPDVRIPVYGWVLLIFLWVLKKSVQEAAVRAPKKKEPTPQVPEIFTPEQTWIVQPNDPNILCQADGNWSIYHRDGKFFLFGDETQELNLTATTVGAAMDQADAVIAALTPEGK
jgi:hypothetical protein